MTKVAKLAAFMIILILAFVKLASFKMSTETTSLRKRRTIKIPNVIDAEHRLNMVVVIPVNTRLKILKLIIQGMLAQVVKPDIIAVYIDVDASKSVNRFVSSLSSSDIPIEIRRQPKHNKWKVNENFRNGKLRIMWWFMMNDVWNSYQTSQVCYFEDDMYPHPHFFKWVKEVRKKNIAERFWGILGTSGGMYTPICLTKYEWAYLMHFYEDYCFSEDMAWDMVLFRLHNHGPLPRFRLEASLPIAVHLGYSNGDTEEKRNLLIEKLNKQNASMIQAVLREPLYAGEKQTSLFADLNGKHLYRGISKRQLFYVLKRCFIDALEPDTPIIRFESQFSIYENSDIQGMDITHTTVKSQNMPCQYVCGEMELCAGYVLLPSGDCWYKTNVATMLKNSGTTVFVKKCIRKTSDGLCIPDYSFN